jgi:hypothetical protein
MRRSTSTLLPGLGALLVLTLMIAGCATMGPPQPPSLWLPKPPSDLRATRKGDRVILTWTIPSVTTDRKTIRSQGPTRICRGLESKLMQCGVPVGQAAAVPNPSPASSPASGPTKSRKQKTAESYTDTLPGSILTDNASGFITYAIEALNEDGRGAGISNQVQVSRLRTLPPPQNFAAKVTGRGVVLSFTSDLPASSVPGVSYVYRVYRRPAGSEEKNSGEKNADEKILVGEVAAGSERSFTLTDSNIEWEKTYEYRAETVTVVEQEKQPELQLEGNDTPEVQVFTHDVFPPAVPSGLQAVFSGPGQQPFIDLVWAPVTDVDLDGYNVYRHEEGAAAMKVNVALVKTPAYRDMNVVSGKHYVYSVSAVDVRGNESARSEEAGETVP